MRAATMKERPSFTLMKQTDVQNIYHMQMPRWLFSDPCYAEMSLEAKLTYTVLLNRFQLSRRSGWVNDFGEVFVIFPRKEPAGELHIWRSPQNGWWPRRGCWPGHLSLVRIQSCSGSVSV